MSYFTTNRFVCDCENEYDLSYLFEGFYKYYRCFTIPCFKCNFVFERSGDQINIFKEILYKWYLCDYKGNIYTYNPKDRFIYKMENIDQNQDTIQIRKDFVKIVENLEFI